MDSTCYGGGSIAVAVLGTLVGGIIAAIIIWWIYKKFLSKRKGGQLVIEDPENAKNDFAFDNPAFKTEQANKSSSPLDTKWLPKQNGNSNMADKRKTVDDTYAGAPSPRIVSLRGSDFTGLGIEIFGGLKEGIFVKKVSSRGPASGIVNPSDRITSITIDFRHIVQEDAISILSYASPYNVQLELIDGKGVLPQISSSPKEGHSPLSHPLYRSSSQDNIDTIERNSRKKLFPNDDSNYPTLKMETAASSSPDPKGRLPSVHKENEKGKKNSFKQHIKDLVEEKLQNRSSSPDTVKVDVEKSPQQDQKKGGLKFGIRVLPPNVNEKIFGKSPTKVDNENNQNLEKNHEEEIKKETPPTAKRRSKDKSPEIRTNEELEFRRDIDLNSSGIKRDAFGIPQEVPNHMMNAAMAAKDNRKSAALDSKKSKGKAPKPPPVSMDIDLDASTTTVDTNLSYDVMDSSMITNKSDIGNKLNFSDNFVDEIFQKNKGISDLNKIEDEGPSNSSTPKSDKKDLMNAQRYDLSHVNHEYDHEETRDGKHIELNSDHITVHQASEEESGDEGRRTASLGDLSKYDGKNKSLSESRSNNGTLERAQSLEMSDSGIQVSGNNSSSKRKPTISDTNLTMEHKDHKMMMNIDMDGMDTIQRGRMKSANEFGTLEDVIKVDEHKSRTKSPGLVKEVVEAAEKFHKELQEDIVAAIEKAEHMKNEDSPKIPDARMKHLENDNDVFLFENKVIRENGIAGEPHTEIREEVMITHTKILHNKEDLAEHVKHELSKVMSTENTGITRVSTDTPLQNGTHHEEHITMAPVTFSLKPMENLEVKRDSVDPNITDQIKIINFGTNIPDDVKVSQYPFGSLERPKSDVIKKLMDAQKQDMVTTTTTTTTTTTILPEESLYLETQPISLTLIGNSGQQHEESDLTESSQISPVYSSDNQGVNSISISSMEVNIKPEKREREIVIPGKLNLENIVTISTESSQPSSIIMIEDEKLDFTLQTPDGSEDGFQLVTTTNKNTDHHHNNHDEHFDDIPKTSINHNDHKTFVTEITVKSPNDINIDENSHHHNQHHHNHHHTNENNVKIISTTPPKSSNLVTNFMANEKQHIEQNYIPRNSEIRFTTSTYETPNKIEKRLSHIDQIRSNFERNNQSEMQQPTNHHQHNNNNNSNNHTNSTSSTSSATVVRKSSIPTLKSPSKIPVFHSNSNKISTEQITTTLVQPKTSPTGNNVNRVSVSVTSIKNSSRHPSGK